MMVLGDFLTFALFHNTINFEKALDYMAPLPP